MPGFPAEEERGDGGRSAPAPAGRGAAVPVPLPGERWARTWRRGPALPGRRFNLSPGGCPELLAAERCRRSRPGPRRGVRARAVLPGLTAPSLPAARAARPGRLRNTASLLCPAGSERAPGHRWAWERGSGSVRVWRGSRFHGRRTSAPLSLSCRRGTRDKLGPSKCRQLFGEPARGCGGRRGRSRRGRRRSPAAPGKGGAAPGEGGWQSAAAGRTPADGGIEPRNARAARNYSFE